MKELEGKTVLITGACGTIGSELIRLLLVDDRYRPARVIGLDNNETELFFLDQYYRGDERVRFLLGDVRDLSRLCQEFRGVDAVFHTAALKHVGLCEASPAEAIQTNIHGVQNVIQAAQHNAVATVVFTSSDKAVNPTNVMGTSKLMGERLITAADSERRDGGTIFTSTRFGNVLGSNGSVIPVFSRQIQSGGPLTLTDIRMTRFVMSVRQAVELVIDSAALARGGEVFVTKMPVVRIEDLAAVMIDELGWRHGHKHIKTLIIGSKPGEKLYEELMTDEETSRALELERYFVIRPALQAPVLEDLHAYPDVLSHGVDKAYISASEPAMNREEIRAFLDRHGLLPGEDGPAGQKDAPRAAGSARPQVRLLAG